MEKKGILHKSLQLILFEQMDSGNSNYQVM